jgi:hypothetical protein
VSAGEDTTGSPAERDPPRTLADAHHLAGSCRPRQAAPLSDWLAFHQRAAAWYAEVAEIDRGHHHEALFMAERQRQLAKELKTQISSQRSVSEEEGG